MKKKYGLLLYSFFLLFLFTFRVHAQTIALPDRWIFKTGDEPAYKEISYDDNNWKPIPDPSVWEDNGYEGKLVKGFENAESPNTMDFYDGGTIEAFNLNVFTEPGFFTVYYEEYVKGLKINEQRRFSRLNNPDWYTIGEWPFLNLRYASSLFKFGNITAAKKLIDRTTDYSKINFNYIAELYNYKNENYDGAVPMVGYGAGAFIITLNDYYKN